MSEMDSEGSKTPTWYFIRNLGVQGSRPEQTGRGGQAGGWEESGRKCCSEPALPISAVAVHFTAYQLGYY